MVENGKQSRGSSEVKSKLSGISRKQIILCGVAVLVFLCILVLGVASLGGNSHRAESYKKINGAAGLNATITYDVHCDKQPCDTKPNYDFNAYILTDSGQQIGVVRPDKDGRVRVALPEGNYVMLLGKQMGEDKLFPQERITLKNGKELELKLRYEEGAQ